MFPGFKNIPRRQIAVSVFYMSSATFPFVFFYFASLYRLFYENNISLHIDRIIFCDWEILNKFKYWKIE